MELPLFLLPGEKISVIVGGGDAKRDEDRLKIKVEDKESLLIRLEN